MTLVPPDELLPLAPGRSVGGGRGAVVEDAPVSGQGEAPPVAVASLRLALEGLVLAVVDAGVDPAAAGRRTVVLQFPEMTNGAPPFAPAMNLAQHGVGVILAVVPRQRAQPGVSRSIRGALFQAPAEVDEELQLALRLTGRIDGLLAPLQQALRVGERPRLLRV